MTHADTPRPPAPPLMGILPMPSSLADLPEPTNGPYYVVGPKGFYLHKTVHQGRVIVPTKDIPSLPNPLDKADCYLWYNEDHLVLPANLVGQVWSFFRTIYERHKSEAMVNLTWHPEHGYRAFVPPQKASAGGVQSQFKPEHIARGWRIIGTIHSHCNFSAFHSGIDTHDADSHDGIHMTIGKVMSEPPEVATMVSVAGKRWDFALKEVLDGPLLIRRHPRWWEHYVGKPDKANAGKHVSQWNGARPAAATPPFPKPVPPPPTGYPTGSPHAQLPLPLPTNGSENRVAPAGPVAEHGSDDLTDLVLRQVADKQVPTGWTPENWMEAVGAMQNDLELVLNDLEDIGISVATQYVYTPVTAKQNNDLARYYNWLGQDED